MRSRGRNSTEFPLPPTGGASPISPRPPAVVKASRSINPRNPPLTSQFVHSRAPCPNAVSGSIRGRFGTATQETPVTQRLVLAAQYADRFEGFIELLT